MNSLDDIYWIDLPSFQDSRGSLTAIESAKDIPFPVKRIFYMYQTSANRGGHAHKESKQVAIAVFGAFTFRLSDAKDTRTFRLDNPSRGLYIPPMVFLDDIVQDTPDSVIIVLANTHYDDERYIRNYADYLAATTIT